MAQCWSSRCFFDILYYYVYLVSRWWKSFLFCILIITNPILLFLSISSFSVSFSNTAALQVSISLNKVELSVGESKFFICTGSTFTTPTSVCVFMCMCCMCVFGGRSEMHRGGLTSALGKSVCCLYDSEYNTIHAVHMVSDSLTHRWLDLHRGSPRPSRSSSSLSSLNGVSTPSHSREPDAGASGSVGWQHTLAGPARLLLAASSLLPTHSAWS